MVVLIVGKAVIIDRDFDVSTIRSFWYITDSKFWSINTIYAYSHFEQKLKNVVHLLIQTLWKPSVRSSWPVNFD